MRASAFFSAQAGALVQACIARAVALACGKRAQTGIARSGDDVIASDACFAERIDSDDLTFGERHVAQQSELDCGIQPIQSNRFRHRTQVAADRRVRAI